MVKEDCVVTNIVGHVDRRRYNPSRDIAYCWPNIMQSTMDRISGDTGLKSFLDHIAKYDIKEEELVEAAKAVATYMAACNKPDESPSNVRDAMEQSGLFRCSDSAKFAIYAALGETMMAAFYLAIRDVLVEDEPSPLNDKMLSVKLNESIGQVLNRRRSIPRRIWDWVTSLSGR
jgi:hypothetical protein